MKKFNTRLIYLQTQKEINKITDDEYNEHQKILYKIECNKRKSLNKLMKNIKQKFGNNIFFCIGDTGCNTINKNIVEFLNKHFICYLVDESYTSKICCKCGSALRYVNPGNIEMTRIVQCTKHECRYVFNRDSNACGNILNKVTKDIHGVEYDKTILDTCSFSN